MSGTFSLCRAESVFCNSQRSGLCNRRPHKAPEQAALGRVSGLCSRGKGSDQIRWSQVNCTQRCKRRLKQNQNTWRSLSRQFGRNSLSTLKNTCSCNSTGPQIWEGIFWREGNSVIPSQTQARCSPTCGEWGRIKQTSKNLQPDDSLGWENTVVQESSEMGNSTGGENILG